MNMEKEKIFKDFLEYALKEHLENQKQTEECRLKQIHKEQLFEMMNTSLNTDQKIMMEEIFQQLNELSDREIQCTYEQGFSDCVVLLKELKVLA